jgi:hypothetical protein
VDSWRKELADAAGMASASSAAVLVPLERFDARLCEAPVSWVIAELDAPRRHPLLLQAALVARTGELGLWRLRQADAEPPCRNEP